MRKIVAAAKREGLLDEEDPDDSEDVADAGALPGQAGRVADNPWEHEHP